MNKIWMAASFPRSAWGNALEGRSASTMIMGPIAAGPPGLENWDLFVAVVIIILFVSLITVLAILPWRILRALWPHRRTGRPSPEPSSSMSNSPLYNRFTDRARKVMQLANQEAQRFNHEYIGTEDILLGLVKEGSGVAANVLKNLDVDLRKIRLEVEKLVQSGPDIVTMGRLPQTPRTKKVIEYSMDEARNLNHNYVGTEHLLLGLLREDQGVGAQVLMNFGLKLDTVRAEILALLGHGLPARSVPAAKPVAAQRSSLDHSFARCGFDKCEQNATFHLTYVEGRKCIRDHQVCEEHARTILDPYAPRTLNHPAVPRVLQDAKEFDIDLIVISELYERQVVFLREAGGQRTVPILVGIFEATSLDRRIKGVTSPRPSTYDAMATIIRTFGGEVQDVIIDKFEDHTYYAKVRMRHGNDLLVVDIRPSDAFVLAIDFDCPVFFVDKVLDQWTEKGKFSVPEDKAADN
jgi:bifunctional DNase/RNase